MKNSDRIILNAKAIDHIEQAIKCIIDFQKVSYQLVFESGNIGSLVKPWEYRCFLFATATILCMRVLHQENYFEQKEARVLNNIVFDEIMKILDSETLYIGRKKIGAEKIKSDIFNLQENIHAYVKIFNDEKAKIEPEEPLIDLLRKPLGLRKNINNNDDVEFLLKAKGRDAQMDFMEYFINQYEVEES